MASNSNIPTGLVIPPTQIFTCDLSPTYTPEDNDSFINKLIISIVECAEIPLPDQTGLWNCNLCGNDDPYSQPVLDTDVIMLQFPANSNTVKKYIAFLVDEEDNIIETEDEIFDIITDGNGNSYLRIIFNVVDVPVNCFSVKIYGFLCVIDDGDLGDCMALHPEMGTMERLLNCHLDQCTSYNTYYTEPYRKTSDDCEDTLLITANYKDYDCAGNYYGEVEDGEKYVLSIRVPGTIDKTEFNFEETEVFNAKRTSKQTESYLFRTDKIPPYVAEQLALIFNSQSITIDGSVYISGKKLSKNNDDGQMWIISTALERECDEIDFACGN